MTDLYLIGGFCFVQHPVLRGVWLRTHPAVAKVACPFCDVPAGTPCMNRKLGKYVGYTHFDRRHAARNHNPKAKETRLTIAEDK